MIPVHRFVIDDGGDSRHGICVHAAQRDQLPLQMTKHDALDGGGCCGNGLGAEQSGQETQHPATESTQTIASAATASSALEFSRKDRTMVPLVLAEKPKLRKHGRRGPTRHEDLSAIDADRAMLAGVIHLDDAIADAFGGSTRCGPSPNPAHGIAILILRDTRRPYTLNDMNSASTCPVSGPHVDRDQRADQSQHRDLDQRRCEYHAGVRRHHHREQ